MWAHEQRAAQSSAHPNLKDAQKFRRISHSFSNLRRRVSCLGLWKAIGCCKGHYRLLTWCRDFLRPRRHAACAIYLVLARVQASQAMSRYGFQAFGLAGRGLEPTAAWRGRMARPHGEAPWLKRM